MTEAKNDESRKRIVVVGAGYGGLLAAVRLAGKSRQAEVVLVNQTEVFVERVRLHQYAANQPVRFRKLVDILDGTGIRFVHGTVDHIDLARRSVSVAGAADLPYDYLVYALGSLTDLDDVPGVRDHAFSLKALGPRSVEDLKTLLPELDLDSGRLVVVGGGATGVEAAAEFAESYPNLQITLATRGKIMPAFPGKPRDHVVYRLAQLGVDVKSDTRIASVSANAVVREDGSEIPFDACVWCGGFKAPLLAAQAGLAVNKRGQVLIDPYMRSISHPDVFALGDAASPAYTSPIEVRMSGFTASITGAHAADCVANVLSGRTPKPLSFAYVGQGIALGRKDVIGFSTYPYGTAHSPMFTGWVGVRVREFFVNFLGSAAILERRFPFYWLGKGRYKTWSQPVGAPDMLAPDRAA